MADNMLSVGIDVGTSTTQLVFSLLEIRNLTGSFQIPKLSISGKRILYQSNIYSTPITGVNEINAQALEKIVRDEYDKAGYSPADVQTGAVIITGESARKENATSVLQSLGGYAGDFVVATAGPDLEAILAGKGSGAYKYSKDNNCTAVNLDIGGGTSNIVLFDRGKVISTGSLDIGGRLIRLDKDLKVRHVSQSAGFIAEGFGLSICQGEQTDIGALERLCEQMVFLLEELLGVRPHSALLEKVRTTGSGSFRLEKRPDVLFFSGGVAEAVYYHMDDPLQYGDIGTLLGKAIHNGLLPSFFAVKRPQEVIRATVIGAGVHSTALSGSTIHFDAMLLPLKNLPILRLSDLEQKTCLAGDNELLIQRVSHILAQYGTERLVFAMKGLPDPTYSELLRLADVLLRTADVVLPKESPLLVLTEEDNAKVLGQALSKQNHQNRGIVTLDSISAEDGDYLDIGKPLTSGTALPVAVKTLAFS